MCNIAGCEKPIEARGWCRMHYGRWYRWGDPEAGDHRSGEYRTRASGCSVEDCDLPHVAKGFCANHYARAHRLRPEPFICDACGVEFTARRHPSERRYCSPKCKGIGRANAGLSQMSIRRYQFKKKYGLTIDDYERIRDSQGGGCAICFRVDPVGRVSKHTSEYWLHVDHDHRTGAIRGLLCGECNTVLGKMNDDPALLRRAADYLDG